MHQSRTLYVGMDVHKDSTAVAYAAKTPPARSSSLAPLGVDHAISSNSSGSCSRKGSIRSLSTKPALVGIGSIAI